MLEEFRPVGPRTRGRRPRSVGRRLTGCGQCREDAWGVPRPGSLRLVWHGPVVPLPLAKGVPKPGSLALDPWTITATLYVLQAEAVPFVTLSSLPAGFRDSKTNPYL